MKTVGLIVYLVFLHLVYLSAQQDGMENFEKFVFKQSKDSLRAIITLKDKIDEVNIEKLELDKSIQRYYKESLENRKDAFSWNHTSSIIIFWMVIIIVFFGLVFSAIQFYISMLYANNKMRKKDQIDNDKEVESQTTLKVSLSGLEVNSSILGVIILIISLAFFYLYLTHVYPVKEFNIEGKQIPEMSARANEAK